MKGSYPENRKKKDTLEKNNFEGRKQRDNLTGLRLAG